MVPPTMWFTSSRTFHDEQGVDSSSCDLVTPESTAPVEANAFSRSFGFTASTVLSSRPSRRERTYPIQGSAAVASPTSLSSPSALDSVTARSTSFWPPSSRLPVTTIFEESTSSGQVWRAKRT